MNDHAIARLEDIDEISDGRCPWCPVRHRPSVRDEPAFKELVDAS